MGGQQSVDNQSSSRSSSKPGQFVTGDPLLDQGIKDAQKAQGQQIKEAIQVHGVPASHVIGELIKQSPIFQQQQKLMSQNSNLLPASSPVSPAKETSEGIQKAGFFGGLFGNTENDILMQRSREQKQVKSQADVLTSLLGLAQQNEKFPLELQKLQGDINQQPLQEQKLKTDVATGKVNLRQMQPEFKAEQAKREAQAKGSFITAPELFTKFEASVQPFIVQRDAYSRIKEAGKSPSAAGDLALIYGYMKMLDPGSTVREGEFATAQNSGSIPQRIQAMYNKVASGQRLATDQRNDFLNRSKRIYGSAEAQYSKTRKEFVKLAIANQLEPGTLIRDVSMEPTKSERSSSSKTIEKLGLDPNKYELVTDNG